MAPCLNHQKSVLNLIGWAFSAPACKCLTFAVVINRFHILETTLWDTPRTQQHVFGITQNKASQCPYSSHLDWDGVLNVYLPYWNGNQSKICDNLVESSLNVLTHLKIQGKMKHVLGGMSFPELLMRSIHAESTCLRQGHQVRILTYLYKTNLFLVDLFWALNHWTKKWSLANFE